MLHEDNKPLGSEEMPTCQVCNLEPAPESVQHLPFIIVEAMLLFVSIKLAVALFFLSYCFSKNTWYCPQCKRQIMINFDVPGSNDNLVLRFGNCMVMLTKNKYRIVAGIIIAVLVYSFSVNIKNTPGKPHLEQTWDSIANNCGYEAFVQNSFRANSLLSDYAQLGQWNIEGTLLRSQPSLQKETIKLYIKMNPTQFKNNETEDIIVYQTVHTKIDGEPFSQGDLLRFAGQWEGREGDGHLLRFVATRIGKSSHKVLNDNINLLASTVKFIVEHAKQQERMKENQGGLSKN